MLHTTMLPENCSLYVMDETELVMTEMGVKIWRRW